MLFPLLKRDPAQPLNKQHLRTIAESAVGLIKIIRENLPIEGEPESIELTQTIDNWFSLAGDAYTQIERLRNPQELPWPGPRGFYHGPAGPVEPLYSELCSALEPLCEHYGWQGISDGSNVAYSGVVHGGKQIPPIPEWLLAAIEKAALRLQDWILEQGDIETATSNTAEVAPSLTSKLPVKPRQYYAEAFRTIAADITRALDRHETPYDLGDEASRAAIQGMQKWNDAAQAGYLFDWGIMNNLGPLWVWDHAVIPWIKHKMPSAMKRGAGSFPEILTSDGKPVDAEGKPIEPEVVETPAGPLSVYKTLVTKEMTVSEAARDMRKRATDWRDACLALTELVLRQDLYGQVKNAGEQDTETSSSDMKGGPPATDPESNEPPEGYVPLHQVLGDVKGNYKTADKVIKEGKIRTWKPSPGARRKYVHAQDWIKFFAAKAKQSFDELDNVPSIAEETKTFVQGAAGRKPAWLPDYAAV